MTPNKEQSAIIRAPEDKILVLAAAGSGKTRVLIWRIMEAIARGARPEFIVAITFTNIAADELARRLLKEGIKIGFVGTLHGYAMKQINLHGQELGYDAPTLITEEDSNARRKAIAKRLRVPASVSLEAIDEAIGQKGTSAAHIVASAFRKEMRAENLLDFTLLLAELETLLILRPFISLDMIAIDEYQDSGARDARIYDLIHARQDFRVGDVQQSMYSFRGGRIENILELAETRAVYMLPTNYRSAADIVAVANRLISDAPETVIPMDYIRPEAGVVTLKEYPNVMTEAASVAAFIRHSGRPAGDFAVLTRFNARAKAVRDALTAEGVAVKVMKRPSIKPATMAALERMAKAPIIIGSLGEALVAVGIQMDEIQAVNDGWKGSLEETILAFKTAEEEAAGEGVHVGTVHSLKGGEKKIIFVVGMEDHTTPGKKKGDDLHEERRIAYVAFTRAEDELHVSWSRMAPDSAGFGLIESIASRFTTCIR